MRVVILASSGKDDGIAAVVSNELQNQGHSASMALEYGGDHLERLKDVVVNADVCVGIISENSSNVLFECGLALGLGLPVVLLVTNEFPLPTDLNSFPCLRTEGSSPRDLVRLLEDTAKRSPRRRHISEPTSSASVFEMLRQDQELFDVVSPDRFEEALFELFDACQYQPKRMSDGRLLGIDFLLENYHGSGKTLVQVKKSIAHRPVSIGAVQQLIGAVSGYKGDMGILVSPSGFTASASGFAEQLNGQLELWDKDKLLSLAESVLPC